MAIGIEKTVEGLVNGTIRSREVAESAGGPAEGVDALRQAAALVTGVNLDILGQPYVNPETFPVENMIGTIGVPVGELGPILIHGDVTNGFHQAVLATNERVLLASLQRGVNAHNESGGVRVISKYNGMTRAPLIRTEGITHSRAVAEWAVENVELLRETARRTSKGGHLDLMNINAFYWGKNVWLRCCFDTGEAMGMNMATRASAAVVGTLLQEWSDPKMGVLLAEEDYTPSNLDHLAVSGNVCTDKKWSGVNLFFGRGYEAHTQSTLERGVIERVFRTTPERMLEVYEHKVLMGSYIAGIPTPNSHAANSLGALMLATGQDIANLVEASAAYTAMEIDGNGNLYTAVKLPILPFGTLGGGMDQPGPKAVIDMMMQEVNLPPDQRTIPIRRGQRLAEIVASVVHVGEVNIIAGFAANQHVKAHDTLGRRR
jgi:hydroxymethylglutaryl-CoA reductase (NADPH)